MTAKSMTGKAESDTKEKLILFDELGQSESRDLLDALSTAMGKRAEPLLLVISTQAARDEAPLSQLIDDGKRVNAGEVVDPSFYLTLFAADEADDPWVRSTWQKANPGIGSFRSLEDIERQALQAQRMPSAAQSFKNLTLNMRVDTVSPFLSMAAWKACGSALSENLYGRRVWAGLELGYAKDMSALILVFQDINDGTFDVVPFAWLPAETLTEHEDSDKMPYRVWVDDGSLLTFPGRVTDPKSVALKIAELHGKYRIERLGYDRWRIEDLRRELSAIGCGVELVPYGQGFKDQSPAVDVLERAVEEGKLRHAGHPVLAMAAFNARVELDAAGNRKLSKRKSTGRIDPLVALANALGVASRPAAKIDVSALIG